jgi:arginyl-tRNA synthetase
MENKIKLILLEVLKLVFNIDLPEKQIVLSKTKKEFDGDISIMLFPLLKSLQSSPEILAEKFGSALLASDLPIVSHNLVNGFLNIVYDQRVWIDGLQKITMTKNFGVSEPKSKPMLLLEYSSPNTNKPLHLGHLRNNFIGYSVAEILKAYGHDVVKMQIINDRGIHICKSMLAWEKFSPLNVKGERETPQNTGIKGDALVGKYYVEFDKHLTGQYKDILQEWEAGVYADYPSTVVEEVQKLQNAREGKSEDAQATINGKIREIAKNQTDLMLEVKEMLVKWEARDPQTYLLWSTMNSWVYSGFESTYKRMGVDFDKLYYESDTYLLGKDNVQLGIKSGVFFTKEDGSVWVDLTADGLDEKLVLRGDGTSVYITQDIGTAIDRSIDFPDMNGMIYTVGNEQDYHFKVLFLILKKLGYSWANNLHHLSYGMVDLPTGKMKSREGTVVDADDLMQEVVDTAEQITKERGHIEGMTEIEKTELYEKIGLGGLKYYLLKVDPKKRMTFNPAESIDLQGNTGPFIQYTFARIQSLLAKNIGHGIIFDSKQIFPNLHTEEKEILKHLQDFPMAIEQAAKELNPGAIANYVYELVKLFNTFYQTIPVSIEENKASKELRIVMCKEVSKVVQLSLKMLGIQVPQKM